jgi:hypothetical protein
MADKKEKVEVLSTAGSTVELKDNGDIEISPAPGKEVTITTTEEKENG